MTEKVFEPKTINVPYGPIGRGALPYLYIFQNVYIYGGNGTVKCLCDDVPELNFEIKDTECNFKCSIDSSSYMITFELNGKILVTKREDPKNLRIVYDNSLVCRMEKWTFADH
jgi:hypothetical protein